MSEPLTPAEMLEKYRNDGSCERELLRLLGERDALKRELAHTAEHVDSLRIGRNELEAANAEAEEKRQTLELQLEQFNADNLTLRGQLETVTSDYATDQDAYLDAQNQIAALRAQLEAQKEKTCKWRMKTIEETAKLQNMAIEYGETKGLLQREREDNAALRAQLEEAMTYGRNLLGLIAPQCEPLGDPAGIMTQLDNYIAGQSIRWSKEQQAQLDALLARCEQLEKERECQKWQTNGGLRQCIRCTGKYQHGPEYFTGEGDLVCARCAHCEQLTEAFRTPEPCGHMKNFLIGDEHGHFSCTVCRCEQLVKQNREEESEWVHKWAKAADAHVALRKRCEQLEREVAAKTLV